MNNTKILLHSFTQLPPGWSFGEGVPIATTSVVEAQRLVDALPGVETGAFPGLDGEVRVTAYQGTLYAECTYDGNSWSVTVRQGPVCLVQDSYRPCPRSVALYLKSVGFEFNMGV